jgi:hypothetical protein
MVRQAHHDKHDSFRVFVAKINFFIAGSIIGHQKATNKMVNSKRKSPNI